MAIKGAEGLGDREIGELIDRGARVVVFRYVISIVVITFRRGATVLVRPGQSVFVAGLPYTLLSLTCGWWGFPFGLIFTPIAVFQNLGGGDDVTAQVRGGVSSGARAPQLGPAGGGGRVEVVWSDGRSYPGTVLQRRDDQVFVRFTDGRELWVPAQYVRSA
jgi:hypothetical protein